jgi:hypothetical protein
MRALKQLLEDPQVLHSLRSDLTYFAQELPAFDVEAGASALARTLATLDGAQGMDGTASGPPADAAGAAVPGSPAAALSSASSAAKPALSFAFKSTLAVVVSTLIGVAGFQAYGVDEKPAPATIAQPAPLSTPTPLIAPAPPPAPIELAPVVGAAPVAQPQPARDASARARDSRSRREIAQLERIRELLADDPAAAFRLAQASQLEFPSGAFREERAGLSIIALFELGDSVSARARAVRFMARYPQSPMRERIQRLSAQ